MPFAIPGSRRSPAPRARPNDVLLSPPLSTPSPNMPPFPITPLLDPDTFDTAPFSESFSAFLGFTPVREESFLASPPDTIRSGAEAVGYGKRASSMKADASYYVEQLTNIREFDSEWEDDEVEEVMIISPKPKSSPKPRTSPLLRIKSVVSMALSGSLSTPNLAAASSIPLPPSPHEDAYTILRTLHCTPSSTLALAVQSHGSLSSSSHALFAIRTCRRPLSRASSAERACLELVSSARIKNPYVEKMRRTWEDGPALYMVLDFHEGGSLLGYIDAQGPVGIQKTERWACETASGITFLHELGIIHSALRPSVIHLRANGHVVIGGFQYSILRSTSSNECPEAMEAIASANDPDPREWQEAPEILLDWEIGFEVDVWSFGIVLGWMVCGRHPLATDVAEMTSGMMRARILQGPGLVSGIQSVDPLMRDVIEKCLERNPAKRLDIAAIKALEYFADVDWDIVEKDLGADIVIPAPLPTQSSADSTSPSFPTILIPPPLFISQTLEQLSSPWNPDLSVSLILEQEFPGNDTQSILSTGTSSLSSDHTNTSRVVLAQAHRTQIVEARPVSVSLEPPAPVADYAPSDPPSPIVRPPNPSPSSSKSTHALDTESGDARASFLPCLSDGEEGTVRVGLGVSVTEFGRLVATDDEDPVPGNLAGVGAGMTVAEREMCMRVQEADAASGAEELSIMAALALPIPVLVGEVPGGVGRASSKKLRKRRKEEHVSASDELQVDVPEISWNGFDGMDDPFRRDSGLAEDDAEGRTVDRTFRWSALPPPATPAHQSTLSQRLRRRSRLLLRKSRSSFFAASPVLDAEEADVPPTPPLPCELGVGVKRIGRGIGYTRAVAASAVVEDLAGVHVGCYPGMGLRRRGAGTEAEAEAGPARIEDSVSSRSVLEIGHGPAVAAMGSI